MRAWQTFSKFIEIKRDLWELEENSVVRNFRITALEKQEKIEQLEGELSEVRKKMGGDLKELGL